MLGLVQDLLDTAALEAGRLELRRSPTDLSALVAAAVEEHRSLAGAKRIALTLTVSEYGTTIVDGDAARLRQVAANLISNAIKYSPDGTTVQVSLAREPAGDRVALRVADEGRGIAPAEAAALFAPFQRLSGQPTGGESSHGLGLWIAHEIVRLHGGELRYEARAGGGSLFVATLPALPVVRPGPAVVTGAPP